MTNYALTLIEVATMPRDEVFKARHLIDDIWQDSAKDNRFERHSPAMMILFRFPLKLENRK